MLGRGDRDGIFYALVFLSGIAALLDQVVWTKTLATLFGVTAHAVGTTLSIFMLGLALGSGIFGSLADRVRRPLRLYALLELGIAATAALSLVLLEGMNALAIRLGFSSADSLSFACFRVAGTFLVLIAPTTLMGGTLPVLAKHCVVESAGAGRKIGLLYASNTLGGVAGSLLAGFVTIPALGLRGSLLLGAGTNGLVALLALTRLRSDRAVSPAAALARSSRSRAGRSPDPGPARIQEGAGDPSDAARGARAMLAGLFLAGFLGLALEVVWTRMLLLRLNATAQAFAAMLAVYLLGLAIGGTLAARHVQRLPTIRAYGVLQAAAGAAAAIGMFAAIYGSDGTIRAVQWTLDHLPRLLRTNAAFQIGCSLALTFVLLFPATVLMGCAFPFGARFFAQRVDRLGRRIGIAFMLNTLGAMLGPLLCAFWFLPRFGMQTTLLLACLGYFVSAAVVLFGSGSVPSRWIPGIAVPGLLLAILLAALPEKIVASTFEGPARIVHHEEDLSGSVVVLDRISPVESFRQLKVGATSMISDNFECRRYTRLIGHLPMLMHPAPRRVLVVCLGSGMTLSAIARHPDVERIDCVDISTGVIRSARDFFREANHAVLEDPRVHVIVNDGRTHLLATTERYDAITLEPPPPNNAEVSNLYSREFYALCRDHLEDGGLISQWIPYHTGTLDQMRSLIATMQAVFPTTTLWDLYNGDNYCVVGHKTGAPIPYARLAGRLERAGVRSDLASVGIRAPEDLLACFVSGPSKIEEFTRGSRLVTDDRPGIGYDLSVYEHLGAVWRNVQLATIATQRYAESPGILLSFADAERQAYEQRLEPVKKAWLLHGRSVQISRLGRLDPSALTPLDREYVAPVSLDPENPYYRYANDQGVYVAALRALAGSFQQAGDERLARRYAEDAAIVESLRSRARPETPP